MIQWLHTNLPQPILLDFGLLEIYWYGFLFVWGVVLAMSLAVKLAKKYGFDKELVLDLSFWLIIFGLIGARLYHVGLEFSYYWQHPVSILKIWQGGLAIHGGIIAGVIVLWVISKKRQIVFWQLASIIAPGLALAQAIGRWGNYFNQELYGQATTVAWGIPIAGQPGYYHPTFLYESLGNLLIFGLLCGLHVWLPNNQQKWPKIVLTYLLSYSLLRFILEFWRTDFTPVVGGWRWPQIISGLIILACLSFLVYHTLNTKNKDYNQDKETKDTVKAKK